MLAATQSQLVQPGASAVSMITDAPDFLVDKLTWRLISDQDGTIVIPESSDAIVKIDDGHDYPRCRYDRPYTAPSTPGRYLAIWRYFVDEIAQSVVVAGSAGTTFASSDDVQARLGRTLTSEEQSQVEFLLNMAAVVITDAAGYDDGWAASLNPVPQMLRLMSVQLVCRSLANPSQYSQIRQQVGSYAMAVTSDLPAGMQLSLAEEMMVRRAVHGRTTQSVHVESGFEKAQDEYWLRKQSIRYSNPNDPAAVIP